METHIKLRDGFGNEDCFYVIKSIGLDLLKDRNVTHIVIAAGSD